MHEWVQGVQMGTPMLLEPRLLFCRVVLINVQQNGMYFTSIDSPNGKPSSLECLIYAFSGRAVPIFNAECDAPLFVLTVWLEVFEM